VGQDTAVSDAESEAVEHVWIEHGPKLWRSLLAFTADADLASDAMAEAFAQALARGPSVRDHAAWILEGGLPNRRRGPPDPHANRATRR
jgi:predicted RNA polymerase sigma factor